MKKLTLIFTTGILLVFTMSSTLAQEDQVRAIFYKAYLANSLPHYEAGVKMLSSQLAGKTDKESIFQMALAKYALLYGTMSTQNEDLFDKHVDETIELLETLNEEFPEWADPYALLSSIYGLKMSYSPWKGMYLGPKSSSLMEKALQLDKQSPLVAKIYGSNKFFTPEMFGGDIKEAIKSFEKALSLYENNSHDLANNWLYLDTMAFLGQAYSKNKQNDKAKAIYEKALAFEPAFTWVKYSLMPSLASTDK